MEGLFQNVKPKSKELYISNITRLSVAISKTDRIDLNNLDFLEDIDKLVARVEYDYTNNKLSEGLKNAIVTALEGLK